MEWVWCKDCVYADDCSYRANSDGCCWGETEEEYYADIEEEQ